MNMIRYEDVAYSNKYYFKGATMMIRCLLGFGAWKDE